MITELLTCITLLYNTYDSLKAKQLNSNTYIQQCLRLYFLQVLNNIIKYNKLLYNNNKLYNIIGYMPLINSIYTLITISVLLPSTSLHRMIFDIISNKLFYIDNITKYYIKQCIIYSSTYIICSIRYSILPAIQLLLPYINDVELAQLQNRLYILSQSTKYQTTQRLASTLPNIQHNNNNNNNTTVNNATSLIKSPTRSVKYNNQSYAATLAAPIITKGHTTDISSALQQYDNTLYDYNTNDNDYNVNNNNNNMSSDDVILSSTVSRQRGR